MKSDEQNRQAITLLDWELSFPFPALESLLAVVLLISVGICMITQMFDPSISIIPGPDFNNTERLQYYLDLAENGASSALREIFTISGFVLAFAIPMQVAFSLAANFEGGLLETLMSYPISRKMLLLTKAVTVIITASTSVILTSALSVGVFFLWFISVFDLMLLAMALCSTVLAITAGALLLAVVSKRVGVTSAGGGALWLGLLAIPYLSQEYHVWYGILNPIQLTVRYLAEMEPLVGSLDVFVGILYNVILGLSLFGLSVLAFERCDL